MIYTLIFALSNRFQRGGGWKGIVNNYVGYVGAWKPYDYWWLGKFSHAVLATGMLYLSGHTIYTCLAFLPALMLGQAPGYGDNVSAIYRKEDKEEYGDEAWITWIVERFGLSPEDFWGGFMSMSIRGLFWMGIPLLAIQGVHWAGYGQEANWWLWPLGALQPVCWLNHRWFDVPRLKYLGEWGMGEVLFGLLLGLAFYI